jgi:hypothetical protein
MTDLTLAQEIAIDAIGLYCDVPAAYGLSAAAFDALCDQVEQLVPTVEAEPARTVAWQQASREMRLGKQHERTQHGLAG